LFFYDNNKACVTLESGAYAKLQQYMRETTQGLGRCPSRDNKP